MILETNTNRSGLEKKKKEQEKGQVPKKYKIKMKLLLPIKGFMSPMNRISSQKRCFIFVRENNA